MTNVREGSTMNMQIIDTTDPDDVREGDVVTLARGERGEPGYVERTLTIGQYYTRERGTLSLVETFIGDGYRITEVRREVPDLPDHAGALAFTDKGLAVNEEKKGLWWLPTTQASKWDWRSELLTPVAATPVPSKELAELVAALDAESYDSAADTLYDFLEACRREWERAGVPEPEVE